MIRYYKLFDLLNRRDMNKSSLLAIISSKTIAKLSKGENLTTDVIEKICLFLECQPGDIMEIVETEKMDEKTVLVHKNYDVPELGVSATDTYMRDVNDFEEYEQLIDTDNPLK